MKLVASWFVASCGFFLTEGEWTPQFKHHVSVLKMQWYPMDKKEKKHLPSLKILEVSLITFTSTSLFTVLIISLISDGSIYLKEVIF